MDVLLGFTSTKAIIEPDRISLGNSMLNKVVLLWLIRRVPVSASLSNSMSGQNNGLLSRLFRRAERSCNRIGCSLILCADHWAWAIGAGSGCRVGQEILQSIVIFPIRKREDNVLRSHGDWNLEFPAIGSWWIVRLGKCLLAGVV